MSEQEYETIEELQGKLVTKVTGMHKDSEAVHFTLEDGTKVTFEHFQDCCEYVYLEDVNGDPEDLVGETLVVAEVREQDGDTTKDWMSSTWTFYTFRTHSGTVTLRWVGESNGYYSERVDMYVNGKRKWRD